MRAHPPCVSVCVCVCVHRPTRSSPPNPQPYTNIRRLGSPSSSSSPASTVTDPNGLTKASLHSSALLPSLDAQSPPLFPHDNETCLHGGVLTNLGCVCGRRTAGYRCETLLVRWGVGGFVGFGVFWVWDGEGGYTI